MRGFDGCHRDCAEQRHEQRQGGHGHPQRSAAAIRPSDQRSAPRDRRASRHAEPPLARHADDCGAGRPGHHHTPSVSVASCRSTGSSLVRARINQDPGRQRRHQHCRSDQRTSRWVWSGQRRPLPAPLGARGRSRGEPDQNQGPRPAVTIQRRGAFVSGSCRSRPAEGTPRARRRRGHGGHHHREARPQIRFDGGAREKEKSRYH